MPSPAETAAALKNAVALHQQGRLLEAAELYEAILKTDPNHPDTHCLLGVLEAQRMDLDSAIRHFSRALRINPRCTPAHASLGDAKLALGRFDEALESFDCALALEPGRADLLNNRGNALLKLGRSKEALASYTQALSIAPAAEIHFNRGNALRELGRSKEALVDYDKAIAAKRDYAEALYKRGAALRDLRRPAEAVQAYTSALAIKPDYAEVLCDRGNAFLELNRHTEAIFDYERALGARPRFAEAHYNRGLALSAIAHHQEAVEQFAELLRIEPDFPYARGELLYSRLHCCNWTDYENDVRRIQTDVAAGRRAATPFAFLSVSDSPLDQMRCAKTYCKDKCAASEHPVWSGRRDRRDALRIAYISADFYDHATAYLTAELFESHDKSRFEISAISLGPDRQDAMRNRLRNAFNRFVDVGDRSDSEVAQLLRDLEIDIAVDLKGYTRDCRPSILAFRPAPIQVNYLGYPGTMGAGFIDYILADRCILPEEQRRFYCESVVYLPDSYQPNDSKRRVSEHPATRREAGLPETGFVFCSFVSHYKIVPRVFNSWMRILAQIEDSVLWLLTGNSDALGNLRGAAQTSGIDPARLVFAPRAKLEQHLARHRVADLFLDTLPINAHTTASDALWAGLPLVTCLGSSFAGRVAASLLNALGLSELAAQTAEEYEAIAISLARDPGRLSSIRTKLAQNLCTHPLFDTNRLCRHIESAYETMWKFYQREESPRGFHVVRQ